MNNLKKDMCSEAVKKYQIIEIMMKGLKEHCYVTAHICGKPRSDYSEQTCSISPLSREIYVRFRKGAQKSSKYDQGLWQRLIREE